MDQGTIVVAGATGNLGGKIVRELLSRDATVGALVRPGSARERLDELSAQGVQISAVDFNDAKQVAEACAGASCVVSALSGLREVIIDAQSVLLDGAVKAGVPRFIPSDYSIDFTSQPNGLNRNLDFRREFHTLLDRAPLRATSIFCGAFADMLTGAAPIILFKRKRVLYWRDADQKMDFTTVANTASFTAAAALDPQTPRFLRIAGDEVSARDLRKIMSEVSGEQFRLFRAGGLGTLRLMIKITRTLFPQTEEIYPPWQGMQYLQNMFSGRAKLRSTDNHRYPGISWTSVRDVLSAHESGTPKVV